MPDDAILFRCALWAGVAAGSGWAAQPITFCRRAPPAIWPPYALPIPGSPAADAKINFCHGFAQGAVDDRLKLLDGQEAVLFPESRRRAGATTMKEFVAWVRATPANRDMPVLDGLFRFFGERFPCK